ncbi:MAG: tetratricopeptide repeat protein [Acidobacteria bacterium]|nr:tetratricopeptide repeat protein [Acidobacteriota bacterium]
MKIAAVFLLISTSLLAQMPAGTRSPLEVEEEQKQAQQQLQRAEDLLQANDFAKARDVLAAIVSRDKKNTRAAYDLGLAEDALNHSEAAKTAYLAAITVDPKQFEAHLALGLLLARNGQMAEARDQLAVAVTLTPASGDLSLRARAWRAMAQIDAAQHPAEARNELLEALKISPETADDRALATQLAVQAGDPASAEAQFRKTLEITSGDVQASVGLARALQAQKKPDEAKTVLQSALAKHPGDPELAAKLASIQGGSGDAAGAIASLEPVVAAHPEDAALKRMLARLYVQGGTPDKALPLYEALLKTTPDDAALLDDWGSALIRASHPAEAQKAFERALANPAAFSSKAEMASVASHLAFAASANKDSETVLRALALRDSVEAPSATSLFLAATAHDRLHHNKLAVELYRQFLKEAAGRYPNEEWEAKHRIPVLERGK